MEINYNVTEESFVEFNLHHARNSKSVMKAMNLQRILVPLIYVLIAFFFSYVLDMPVLFLVIPFLIMGILWVLFYPAYFYRHIRRTARKMLGEGKNEGMLGNHTLFLTEEGIREISKKGETAVSWAGVENFTEDDSNFYLYNNAMSALIVPKTGLADVTGIRRYVQERLEQSVV